MATSTCAWTVGAARQLPRIRRRVVQGWAFWPYYLLNVALQARRRRKKSEAATEGKEWAWGPCVILPSFTRAGMLLRLAAILKEACADMRHGHADRLLPA